MNELYNRLYDNALKAYHNSYSPYSNFKVGAAILLKDDSIIIGTNVENASYGLSNCAERTAMFSVYANGYKKEDILMMMVIANTASPVSPCGACRQVMVELLPKNVTVVLTNLNKQYKVVSLDELLPYSFTEGDLNV